VPFTRAEVARVLAACDEYGLGYGHAGKTSAWRLKTLVQLLRFSGLRIRDAVTLRRDHVVDGKLLLYTAKTGVPVYCPLPDIVFEALSTLPGREYFFWSGVGKPKSCVGDWQRSLKKLFRLAGVPEGHAHRFRHTFATDLLLAGVPLDRVATLLGHANSRITERHYAPWIRARQEQLEADVRRVWNTCSSVEGQGGALSTRDRIN
jgi:integrase